MVDQFYARLQREGHGRWDTSSFIELLGTTEQGLFPPRKAELVIERLQEGRPAGARHSLAAGSVHPVCQASVGQPP